MKIIVLILICFITSIHVQGQSWDVKIRGNVTNMDREKLSNIQVLLIENQDTIERVNSNEKGEFTFIANFTSDNSYYVTLAVEYQRSRSYWVKLYENGDTNRFSEYQLDLVKLRVIHDRFDTGIYYELNEINEFQNFDIAYFKSILAEYPQMCIRFVQTINPEEKKQLAKKRKKEFLKVLRSSGVNMDQLIFLDELFILDLSNTTDKRSRIEGIVYSMDGNCK